MNKIKTTISILAFALAQMALGEMALKSQAGMIPSDALTWFSAASQTGRLDAKRAIGEMYLKGQGIILSSLALIVVQLAMELEITGSVWSLWKSELEHCKVALEGGSNAGAFDADQVVL